MSKVFISHATVDKALADAVQTLIETGVGLPHHEVFCTSLEGLGIPEGTADFKDFIRKQMLDCDTVVALISENYYGSAFCMCELGAIWVLAKNFFPILVAPVDFKDLRGALTGMQCRKLDDPATASALYTRLTPLVEHPVPIQRWDLKKELFLKNLKPILDSLEKPKTVKVEEHERVKSELAIAKALNLELEEEIGTKQSEIKKLYKAKDAEEGAVIRKEFSSKWQQYESAVADCSRALAKVSRVVREALFYWARGENFAPPREWFDEVELAVENDELVEARMESNRYEPNDDRPPIAKAMKAVKDLKHLLSEMSPDLDEMIRSKTGDSADVRRRSYWEKFLAK